MNNFLGRSVVLLVVMLGMAPASFCATAKEAMHAADKIDVQVLEQAVDEQLPVIAINLGVELAAKEYEDVADSSPFRTKLLTLLEQEGKLVKKAVEQLKEHDCACTGPLIGTDGKPVWATLFKDLQHSPLINCLEEFGPINEQNVATALMLNKEHLPTLGLLHTTIELRLARKILVPIGKYFLEQYALRKGQLVHAVKMWGDVGRKQYITSTDVLKSLAKDEFEIFDTNVDKILASLYGDTQIFMACAFSKLRAYLAAGYLASRNQEMSELLYFNMFGFKLFAQEILFNPAYTNIWQTVRISGKAKDEEFLMPFSAAVSDVFRLVQASCVAKIKGLSAMSEETKLIDHLAGMWEDYAAAYLRDACRIGEKLGGAMCMQYMSQLELEILQECLA